MEKLNADSFSVRQTDSRKDARSLPNLSRIIELDVAQPVAPTQQAREDGLTGVLQSDSPRNELWSELGKLLFRLFVVPDGSTFFASSE